MYGKYGKTQKRSDSVNNCNVNSNVNMNGNGNGSGNITDDNVVVNSNQSTRTARYMLSNIIDNV